MECSVSDLVKRGHEQAAELKSSCGAIDVRSVAQLISDLASHLDVQLARSNALATENETLKYQEPKLAAMMSCLDAFYAAEDVPERAMMAAYNILRKSVRTPATDAFLAEVRAQGVEMFAAHCQKRHGEMMKSEPNEAASNQAITATRRAGEFAMYFAAQLRKGAAL